MHFHLRHTMIPVADLERSIDFYCRYFDMQVIRRRNVSSTRFGSAAAYIGYGPETTNTVLELISGTGGEKVPWAGHICFSVSDVKTFCDRLAADGFRFTRPLTEDKKHPGRMSAVVLDPDGFEIELTPPPEWVQSKA